MSKRKYTKGYNVSMGEKLAQVDVSFWAVDAVEWAAEIGVLTENSVGYVVATEAASRADVAEAFMAFINYYA